MASRSTSLQTARARRRRLRRRRSRRRLPRPAAYGGSPATRSPATRPGPSRSTRPSAVRPCTHAPAAAARERVEAPGEEPGDDAGEHVAAAGGGQLGAAGRVQRDRPSGAATTVPGPFSSTTAPERVGQGARGRRAGRRRPGAPMRRSYSPAWGVRTAGAPSVRRASQRGEVAGERVEAVGVEHERRRGPRRPACARRTAGRDRRRRRARDRPRARANRPTVGEHGLGRVARQRRRSRRPAARWR